MIRFCTCNSKKYRWLDIAKINARYYIVNEKVGVEGGKDISEPGTTLDVSPVWDELARVFKVDRDEIELATFEPWSFPEEVISKLIGDRELGGYCAVCGGDI